MPTGRRERRAGLAADEQGLPEEIFQCFDASADRRLGNVQGASGFAEMGGFRDRQKGSCEIDVHMPFALPGVSGEPFDNHPSFRS